MTPGISRPSTTRFPSSLTGHDNVQIEELLRLVYAKRWSTCCRARPVRRTSSRRRPMRSSIWSACTLAAAFCLRENEGWSDRRRAGGPHVEVVRIRGCRRPACTSCSARLERQTHLPGSRRTCQHAANERESLLNVESVVAAPILDGAGQIIGILYGDCRGDFHKAAVRPLLTKVEAMLVELLAVGVGAGLARVEQEKKMLEADVRFGQFFTKELSRQLALQPDLLAGRTCEVTILFTDVRGFSRISERLGPADTVAWLGDVMGELSDCVLAHRGVLVDYIGDELLAMWGAPEEQADHAGLACRAATSTSCPPAGAQRAAGRASSVSRWRLGVGVNRHQHRPRRQHGFAAQVQVRAARPPRQPRQSRPGRDEVSAGSTAHHRVHARRPRRRLQHPATVPGARRQH